MGRQKAAPGPARLLERASHLTCEAAAQQVITDAKGYLGTCLDPFLKAAGPQYSRSAACTQLTAKSCSSFVIHLLRAAMTQVTDEQPPGLREAAIQLASLGLEALSLLRGTLKGKPYEVEMQRYMLLRKLMSLRSYSSAMDQAWLLYVALCCQWWQRMPAQSLSDCNGASIQPLPMADTCSNTEVASLVIGTVLNLLLSVTEHGVLHSEISKIMSVANDHRAIMSWLRWGSCGSPCNLCSPDACIRLQAHGVPLVHRCIQQQTCLHRCAAPLWCAGCCQKQNRPSTLTPCFDIYSRSGCCSLRCISQKDQQHSPALAFDFSQTRVQWIVQAANQALSSDQPGLRSVCAEICSCTLQACGWSPSHARLPQVQAKTFWNANAYCAG